MLGFTKEKMQSQTNRIIQLPLSWIRPNPHQPRTEFNADELASLAESIRQNGLLQPLTVRKKAEDIYELVAGERRLRAVRLLEMETISCIIVEMDDKTSAIMALVENIQRQELSFFDEASAIAELITIYGLTQEDAAIKLGKAQSTIANKLRLLKITAEERRLIIDHNLTERHARALLKIKDFVVRTAILNHIIKFNMNVEQAENHIENFLTKERIRSDLAKTSRSFKDVKLFINTINKAVETMKIAGISASTTKISHDDCIEYRIFIPVEKAEAKKEE